MAAVGQHVPAVHLDRAVGLAAGDGAQALVGLWEDTDLLATLANNRPEPALI